MVTVRVRRKRASVSGLLLDRQQAWAYPDGELGIVRDAADSIQGRWQENWPGVDFYYTNMRGGDRSQHFLFVARLYQTEVFDAIKKAMDEFEALKRPYHRGGDPRWQCESELRQVLDHYHHGSEEPHPALEYLIKREQPFIYGHFPNPDLRLVVRNAEYKMSALTSERMLPLLYPDQ